MNNFNSEIYNLLLMAGGETNNNIVKISKNDFEIFMKDFVEYVQDRQKNIVNKAEKNNTYMGDDVPSFILIQEVKKSIQA